MSWAGVTQAHVFKLCRAFTVHFLVELLLRQVGRQHRQLTERQQRLLLHKVARLHVGLAVERPVSLQTHNTTQHNTPLSHSITLTTCSCRHAVNMTDVLDDDSWCLLVNNQSVNLTAYSLFYSVKLSAIKKKV